MQTMHARSRTAPGHRHGSVLQARRQCPCVNAAGAAAGSSGNRKPRQLRSGLPRMPGLRLTPTRVPGWRSDDADGRCHRKRNAKNRVSERRALQHPRDGRLTAALRVPTMRSRAAACAWPKMRRVPPPRLAKGWSRVRFCGEPKDLAGFDARPRGNCSHTLVLIGNVNRDMLVKGPPGRK